MSCASRCFLTQFFLLVLSCSAVGQTAWRLQPVALQTRWAKEVRPDNVLKEYPRPQMTRAKWINLNGLWDYAVTKKDSGTPTKYDGQILVSYSIESALSGVKKALQPNEDLWYHRKFQVPELGGGRGRLLLNFGAVDWQATVYVNGNQAGSKDSFGASHTGGYTAFTLDITAFLKPGNNEIRVKVYDPTDAGIGPHGKQTLEPGGIYYTATSGIWQTVWLETVPRDYIESLTITPNVYSSYVAITVNSNTNEAVSLTANHQTISGQTNHLIKFQLKNAHLWSPEHPHLYDLDVKTPSDEVKSYFGMRKVSIGKDQQGTDRIFLNNKPYYNLGVLDQGFWPEGLYTAPTDEALAFDIKAIKAMGFNTIRKHIKVEPPRWYYWADKLGVLVWQDMVNPNEDLPEGAKPEFEKESAEILTQLHNSPCITTWVLFNEGWGQYDQKRLTEWIKRVDPTRLVDGHTGEVQYFNGNLKTTSTNPYPSADMTDVHSYSEPMLPLKQNGKAQVLGEFGGIGISIPDHEWDPITGLRYTDVAENQYAGKYHFLVENLAMLKDEGLSGSIFTQPYDVENEENGLMTYDREIAKIPFKKMRKLNSLLNPHAEKNVPDITVKNADTGDQAERYANLLEEYQKGNRGRAFLKKLAILAWHVNNRNGAYRIAADYINTINCKDTSLSKADIRFINQFTRATDDPGFKIMLDNVEQFQKVLGEHALNTALMNAIYHGQIEEILKSGSKPDWDSIAKEIHPYGEPGKEILLRMKTIYYLNAADWNHYLPSAKAYLQKYGKDLSPQEQKTYTDVIREHENSATINN